jgi:Zn-dependent peptidase ImmA (M78 family)
LQKLNLKASYIKFVEEFISTKHGWNFPIYPEIICDKLNIKIESKILPKYAKSYFEHESNSIILNSASDKHTKRYTIAMELWQTVLKVKLSHFEKFQYATELLMPTNEFIKIWENSFPTEITQCAIYFDVSKNHVMTKAKLLIKTGFLQNRIHKHITDINQ